MYNFLLPFVPYLVGGILAGLIWHFNPNKSTLLRLLFGAVAFYASVRILYPMLVPDHPMGAYFQY